MAEYTFSRPTARMEIPDLVVVLGGRIDWNSRFGWQATPRLSAKYNFTEKSIVRISAGRGFRSPNVVAENISLLASNRSVQFSVHHLEATILKTWAGRSLELRREFHAEFQNRANATRVSAWICTARILCGRCWWM
jgi:outer membrane receptor for ferrienterochelin and colicins